MKPVSLINLSFYNEDEINIVSESQQKTFSSFEYMQKYIDKRLAYWSNIYDCKLKVDPDSIETLIVSEAQSVLKHVSDFMGVDYDRANSDLRDTEYIEARRFAMNICFMRKMGKSSIGRGLGVDHATVKYHIEKHKHLSETDKYYESRFIRTYEYVMEKIGGNYREDGSGQKVEL